MFTEPAVHVNEQTLVPGNGTQYDFTVVTRLDGTVLVCLYDSPTRHSGRCMVFDQANEYAPYYVAGKLKCGLGDAGVLLTYLRKKYEIDVYLDARYNPENGVWIGHVIQ
jgi:hypothetical protein